MQEEGLALGDTCYPQHCAHLATGFISFLYIKFQVTQPEVKTTHPPLGCSWCSAGKWGLNLSPWPNTRFQKMLVWFCRGPSWKIPQEVQSRVSSRNWILKFTSARTNCAGSKWDVPSPGELQGCRDDAFPCCR